MKKVSVAMDEATLHRLMASGALCAADLKCLDCESKACVWRIALKNAGQALGKVPESIDDSQAWVCLRAELKIAFLAIEGESPPEINSIEATSE